MAFRRGLDSFTNALGQVFEAAVLLGFLLKVLLFSLAVGILLIASTLAEHRVDGDVPAGILSGVARLFLALALIETAFLAVKYV
ncbi:MAG: hypothetical protein IPJ25_02530 [Rhodocyclaceae bacterium]|nr:hypothetical protein [Rhodocyclaceae bacterium]